jgi:HNH endonuclease
MTAEERFWKSVVKTDSCWIYKPGKYRDCYPHITINYKAIKAHRYSKELAMGKPIPAGLHVLHNCPNGDNPACVNPDHLWIGTNLDNIMDKMKKGRQAKGTSTRHAKLTDDKVAEIRAKYKPLVYTQWMLAEEYDVCQQTICKALQRKTWK